MGFGDPAFNASSRPSPIDVVIAPASALDDHLASFDGVTGRLLQDSGLRFIPASGILSRPAGVLTIGSLTAMGSHFNPTLNNTWAIGADSNRFLEIHATTGAFGGGTTAQRPAGINGKIRYNTTLNKLETYEDGEWRDVLTSSNRIFAYDVSTQLIVLADTWEDLLFDTNGPTNGWGHVADTNLFTCPETGFYEFEMSASAEITGGAPSVFAIHALDDADGEIAGSGSITNLTANNVCMLCKSFFHTFVTAGDEIEIEMRSDNAAAQIAAIGGGGLTIEPTARISIKKI